MRLRELEWSGWWYALAGLLQLPFSFLVSELSVESFVGFFPRRKRAIGDVRAGRESVREEGLVWERDETVKIGRPNVDDRAAGASERTTVSGHELF